MMREVVRDLLLGVVCLGFLSGSAVAQSLQFGGGSRSYTAAPGQTIKVGQHYSLNRSCKVTGIPEVRLYSEPTMGKVEHATVTARVDTGVRDSQGRSNDIFDDCVGQPIQAIEIRYTAGSQRGRDHFSYQLVWPGGFSRVEIQVRVR